MATTIVDVAKRAKVSIATVSRVLNRKDSRIPISISTKQRVMDAVGELSYKPNALARGLVQQRTKTIGVIVPNMSTMFFPEVVESIENVARARGYQILLAMSEDDADEERRGVETFLEKRVDGVIVAPTQIDVPNAEYFEDIQTSNVPMVFIDLYLGKMARNFVIIDNKRGAYDAVSYLIKLGHRRIGHICGPRDLSSIKGRLAGYKKALVDNRIDCDESLIKEISDLKMDSGYECMKEFLKMDNMPTAIFAANDMVALGAMKAISESGLHMPDDMSIVGFDDIELASYLPVPLTTVSQEQQRIGEVAAGIVIDEIEQKTGEQPRQVVLEPRLIVRKSCKVLEST